MKSCFPFVGAFVMLLTSTISLANHHDHEPSCTHEKHTNTTNSTALKFVENKTQWNSNVNFKATLPGGALFLEDRTFTYCYMNPEDHANLHDYSHLSKEEKDKLQLRYHAYKVNFVSNANPSVRGEGKHQEYFNYYLGQDQSKWSSNVGIYDQVVYDELYEGVDLVAKSHNGQFKYDLVLEPGANMQSIAFSYEGVDGLQIRDGALIVKTSVGEIIEAKPYSFQFINGVKTEVNVQYVLDGNTVRFIASDGYDQSAQLIIDPTVIASTLSGTNGADNYGHCAAFDDAGNIYTGAISFGAGYPTTTGAFQMAFNAGGGFGTDIAVSKLNPDGSSLIWASYLGGADGEYPHSLFVSNDEELTVYGSSSSNDFPTTTGAYDETHNGGSDIVVTKFSDDGTALIGSTYMGGNGADGQNIISTNYGDTYRGEIILDATGNVYIASFTGSIDFPVSASAYQSTNAGSQDAVVFKLDPTCENLEWSTYLGSSGDDSGYGLRLDDSGNVYVTGTSGNADFPVTAGTVNATFVGGTHDGFIAELSPDGSSLIAATFLGSSGKDESFFLDIDTDGDIYVYGQNADVITIDPAATYGQANSTQFIGSFSPDLTTQNFITVFGTGTAGGAWPQYDCVPIAFMVDNCGFIYVSGHSVFAQMPTSPGALYTSNGFYLMVLQPDATGLEYATYYEGADHVDGGTSRFDPNGVVYQAVCTSGVFPVTSNAYDQTQPSGWDIGVFKIDFEASGVSASAVPSPAATGCVPLTVNFTNASSAANNYIWHFDDGPGSTSTAFEPSYTFTDTGTYNVMLIAIDSTSCNFADTAFIEIIVVANDLTASFSLSQGPECEDSLSVNLTYTGTYADDITWNLGDNTTATGNTVSNAYYNAGSYTITLTASENICGNSQTVSQVVTYEGPGVDASSMIVPNVFSPNNDQYNETFCPAAANGSSVHADELDNYTLVIYNRWGKKIFDSEDGTRCWDGKINGDPAAEGVYYWITTFSGTCGEQEIRKDHGHVTLLR